MPERVEVEVLTMQGVDVPATRATLDKLSMLGMTATVTVMDRVTRDVWRRRGFPAVPVVMVWLGEGDKRVRYFTWDGFKPRMLELTQRLATVGV